MTYSISENDVWLTEHGKELGQYAGKWVAIDQARLIAVADTLKELEKKSEVKAAKHPAFYLVPRPEEAISIL